MFHSVYSEKDCYNSFKLISYPDLLSVKGITEIRDLDTRLHSNLILNLLGHYAVVDPGSLNTRTRPFRMEDCKDGLI